ncbi:MAG: hypothetical protein ACKVH8_03725 [Pirellulales bacterium]
MLRIAIVSLLFLTLCAVGSVAKAEDFPGPEKIREMQTHLRALQQGVRQAEESGSEEAANRFRVQIKQLSAVLEHIEQEKGKHGEHQEGGREDKGRNRKVEELKQVFQKIERELDELRAKDALLKRKGDREHLEELHKVIRQREEQLRELMQEMHKYSNHDDHEHGKEGHHEDGNHEGEGHHQSAEHQEKVEQFHRRVKALHEAAGILERGGIHDVAHQLHQQAEQMEREVEKHHQEGRQVRELTEALQQTREELEEMRHHLRRMHEMLEDLHHEEFEDDEDEEEHEDDDDDKRKGRGR